MFLGRRPYRLCPMRCATMFPVAGVRTGRAPPSQARLGRVNEAWVSDPYNLQKLALFDVLTAAGLRCGANWFVTEWRSEDAPPVYRPVTDQGRQALAALFPISTIADYTSAFVSAGAVDASFSEPVPTGAAERRAWFAASLAELQRCDVLFLDPDTGVQCGARSDARHVTPDEIREASALCHVVVYQHRWRATPASRRATLARVLARNSIHATRLQFLQYPRVSGAQLIVIANGLGKPLPSFTSAFEAVSGVEVQ